jgi:hypothetical protein
VYERFRTESKTSFAVHETCTDYDGTAELKKEKLNSVP